jgi:hypothetical protein
MMKNKFERDESCPDHRIKDIGERWLSIKAQAQDSGIHRVTTWLKQKNPQILEARNRLCRGGRSAFNPKELKNDTETLLEASVSVKMNDTERGSMVGWQKYVAPDVAPGESVLKSDFGLEGIDVYCDRSCYEFDEDKKGTIAEFV